MTLYLSWQLKSYLILPPLNKLPPHSYIILPRLPAQLLIHFNPLNKLPYHSYIFLPTPLGNPALASFYPLNKYPLTLTPFYPFGSPTLISFYPSEQITHSLFHHFISFGGSNFASVYSLLTIPPPPTLTTFTTLGSSTRNSIFPASEQPYPSLLNHFTLHPHPWQLKTQFILPPLNKLSPLAFMH